MSKKPSPPPEFVRGEVEVKDYRYPKLNAGVDHYLPISAHWLRTRDKLPLLLIKLIPN